MQGEDKRGGILLKRLLQFITGAAFLAAAWINAGGASEAGAAHTGSSLIADAIPSGQPSKGELADNEPNGTVRVVGILTDLSQKYMFLIPDLPFPPFQKRRQWFKDRGISVHCALEWKDDKGTWWYAEIRSSTWDHGSTRHRVGCGQFPGIGYIAYGIFINPGRVPRDIDLIGRTLTVACDFPVKCDYKKLDAEIRKYGAFGKKPGDLGTGGYGKENIIIINPRMRSSRLV